MHDDRVCRGALCAPAAGDHRSPLQEDGKCPIEFVGEDIIFPCGEMYGIPERPVRKRKVVPLRADDIRPYDQ